MVDEFFNTVKTTFIIIVVAIIIIVAVVAIKSLMEKMDDREYQRKKEEEKKKIEIKMKENEVILERKRDMYWDNLCLVYGDKDRDTLIAVLDWLEKFERLPEFGDEDYSSQVSMNRSECRETIKRILGYPQWIIQNDDVSDTPVWLDLDIKYVKMLLH